MQIFIVSTYLFLLMVRKLSTSPLILGGGASNVDFAHSCAFNCTTRYIPLWTNLLNFQTPSQNLFSSVAAPDQRATSSLLGPAENQAIKATCRVFDGYSDCIRRCPADSLINPIMSTINGLTAFCANDARSVDGEPFKDAANCFDQYASSLRKLCKNQNEALLAASLRLQNLPIDNTANSFVDIVQDICQKALNQMTCIFPPVVQKCDNSGANLFDMILQSSVGSLRQLISSGMINRNNTLPNCQRLFDARLMLTKDHYKLVTPEPGKTFEPKGFLLWPTPDSTLVIANKNLTLNESIIASLLNFTVPNSNLTENSTGHETPLTMNENSVTDSESTHKTSDARQNFATSFWMLITVAFFLSKNFLFVR